MPTLLRIDASARLTGSHSRQLADHFEARWRECHPNGRVVTRDLAREPVPHLNQATLDDFADGRARAARDGSDVALSDAITEELLGATHLLVASPVYNFTVPSTLKAWIDHAARAGRTFEVRDGRYVGLLTQCSACVVTSRGGAGPESGSDFQGEYLEAVLAFLGCASIERVALEGTAGAPDEVRAAEERARAEIDGLACLRREGEPRWIGAFTRRDRDEIDALRTGQVDAIGRRDPDAYARLCADDVALMLQGREAAVGRERFLEVEAELLGRTRFRTMRQVPVRIERHGDLVVELGRQELEVEAAAGDAEHYHTRRKYLHVLRRTPDGWRFAALMSSNDE